MNRILSCFAKNHLFRNRKLFENCSRTFAAIAFQCNERPNAGGRNSSLNFSDKKSEKFTRCYSTQVDELSSNQFEVVCSETLEHLSDYFDELIENNKQLEAADVVYQDGVLTASLGDSYGTYVINKQTPNKQIWLSSPISGPKRFDFAKVGRNDGYWIYRHTNEILHELLDCEFGKICGSKTKFQSLPFGTKKT